MAKTSGPERRTTLIAEVGGRARLAALGEQITGTDMPADRAALPWRSTRDPWAILVSELMAQQTQLSRVVGSYQRFLDRFPTPAACASAPLGDVLRAWAGLGYNRRARHLHAAAHAVVHDFGGEVPSSVDSLLALPGVGPYTARAVAAFAFGLDVGVVDTNAGRVLARAVAGRPLVPREAQTVVDAMVPPGRGWEFGQRLLDLGALTCTSREPRCGACPLRRRCRWRCGSDGGADPARGSAGVSGVQSPFSGSDREGRGRLVRALRAGPVPAGEVAVALGWDDDPVRGDRVVAGLVRDGLVVRRGNAYELP
jgi:A/G-specific adenine glycosylase